MLVVETAKTITYTRKKKFVHRQRSGWLSRHSRLFKNKRGRGQPAVPVSVFTKYPVYFLTNIFYYL